MIEWICSFVDLEEGSKDWKRWTRRFLLFFIVIVAVMALGRAAINPNNISFPDSMGTIWDYRSMIGMGMLLIAIDAMILVLISFRTLQTWQSVLAVSVFVASTHILYPLFTFGITVGVYYLAHLGFLPYSVAHGTLTAIFFIALVFVFAHLREVHENIRDGKGERFVASIKNLSRSTLVALAAAIFPEVHGVSIDALMVGPAKIAFVARYETSMFLMSFVYIGIGVGVLVLLSGFVVMAINRYIDNHEHRACRIQLIDYYSSLLLVVVFIHFSVFAGLYWLYTFTPHQIMLETWFIWCLTGVLSLAYFSTIGKPDEVKKAAMERTRTADVTT